jgi:hypothetical protein
MINVFLAMQRIEKERFESLKRTAEITVSKVLENSIQTKPEESCDYFTEFTSARAPNSCDMNGVLDSHLVGWNLHLHRSQRHQSLNRTLKGKSDCILFVNNPPSYQCSSPSSPQILLAHGKQSRLPTRPPIVYQPESTLLHQLSPSGHFAYPMGRGSYSCSRCSQVIRLLSCAGDKQFQQMLDQFK